MKNYNEKPRDTVLEHECFKLAEENALLLDFIHLAAASKKLNGSFSNSREALHKKARVVLDKINR
jgi:hypothetical protein